MRNFLTVTGMYFFPIALILLGFLVRKSLPLNQLIFEKALAIRGSLE